MSTTGGQIVDRVMIRLEESTASPVFYSRAEAFGHLNDAANELNLLSGKFKSERDYEVVTGNFQDVPTDAPIIVALLHMSYNSKPLEKRTLEGLDRENIYWRKTAAEFSCWAPVGLNKFALRPRRLDLDEAVRLTTLDMHATIGEATVIDLEAENIEALEKYVFHAMRFKEGGPEFANSLPFYDAFLSDTASFDLQNMVKQFTAWSKEPSAHPGQNYGGSLQRG